MSAQPLNTLAWRSLALGAGIGLVLLFMLWLAVDPPVEPARPDNRVPLAEQRPAAGLTGQASQSPESMPAAEKTVNASLESIRLLADQRNQIQSENQTWQAFVIQPDPAIERFFLLVASSEHAARAFNSYFGFYFNQEKVLMAPSPVLIVDRLFQESSRQQVLADRSYFEPELASELAYWLALLVDDQQGQEICDFVIACYQTDFASRLADHSVSSQVDWQKNLQLTGLEVTYHAGRQTYCTFEPA